MQRGIDFIDKSTALGRRESILMDAPRTPPFRRFLRLWQTDKSPHPRSSVRLLRSSGYKIAGIMSTIGTFVVCKKFRRGFTGNLDTNLDGGYQCSDQFQAVVDWQTSTAGIVSA